MGIWARLFGKTHSTAAASAGRASPTAPPPGARGMTVGITTDLNDVTPAQRMESSLATIRYESGPAGPFYERMSRDLLTRHGPLLNVDFVSHFPKFEIYFHYQDGTRLYSGQRTGNFDLHFLTLGYVGEGPRYARHFLNAAGVELSSDEIDSLRPGDSIKKRDGKAIIVRKDEQVREDEQGVVKFSHERREVVAGGAAIYRHYTAPTKAAATFFLEKQDVTAQSFFVVVETPEGVVAKDRMGIFEQT